MISTNNLLNRVKKLSYFGILVVTLPFPVTVSALSSDQINLFNSGIYYFDVDSGTAACAGYTATTGGGASGGSYNLNQVKTFASTPIASTWNISDSTVEHWFLKQAGAQPVITRYGLNLSNIGQITSAVKSANVSPVYFYLYAVNEAGAGSHNYGFINARDRSGLSGPAAATADAQYLADQSKIMNSIPSWYDGGQHPIYDFVPKDVQSAGNADFKKMPSGTLGRAGIPASAATTWEVYYPNGLKKEYNHVQNYGAPLENDMNNIQSMGGDPQQGGATLSANSCTPGVAGQGITKAVNWAVMIAKNDGYGYDQNTRTSGWTKWQSDPSCTHQCGSFDCSSFIAAALTEAGYFKTNPNFGTGTDANGAEATSLIGAGFKRVADSATTSSGLLPGDILLWNGHTEMYIGNDQAVAAHINENGQPNGGQVGDQNGQEISVTSFAQSLVSDPWIGVYRAQN